jgi:hypothetical protein
LQPPYCIVSASRLPPRISSFTTAEMSVFLQSMAHPVLPRDFAKD